MWLPTNIEIREIRLSSRVKMQSHLQRQMEASCERLGCYLINYMMMLD